MLRRILAAAAVASLVLPSLAYAQPGAPTGPKPELKSLKQQASYAIGLNFGQQVSDAELDAEALVRGVRDALTKADPLLTEEQITTVMTSFAKEMQAKAQEKGKEASKVGDDFIAANAKKPGVKTTKSGLQYKVLKSGEGATPKKDSVVRVHYHGTLPSGKVFDSSVDRKEPAEFPVNRVIPGWTEALQLMKVGDKWQIVLPADLAYGAQGAGRDIGPNQVLIFDVELLDIVK